MIPFSGMITHDGTVSFTHTDGRIYTILPSHVGYTDAVKLINELAEDSDNADLRFQLFEMTQPKRIVAKSSNGRILVDGGDVTFDGKPVEPVIAKRLIWMIEQGFNAEPLFKFLTNLSENPSYRAVKSLYAFMDANKMAITNNGMILAYKTIRPDYKDIYSGKFDNSVGQAPAMPRNEVDDDPNVTCSSGLHVCSISYIPSYGINRVANARVVICEIHPRDVVSVPVDYNNAKMRTCGYKVVGEIEEVTDILGSSAVITPKDKGWLDDEGDVIIEIEEVDQWSHPKEAFDFNAAITTIRETFVAAYCEHFSELIDLDSDSDKKLPTGDIRDFLYDIDVNMTDEVTVGELYQSYMKHALSKL